MLGGDRSPDAVRSYGFIKFGKRVNMEALLRRGELYCQPLGNFQRLEEDPAIGRADADEGLTHFFGAAVTRITATAPTGAEFHFSPGTGPIRLWDDESMGVHVYSLAMVTEPYGDGYVKVPEDLLSFGDSFVLIHEPLVFLERVEAHAPRVARHLNHGVVQYVSRTAFAGAMGPFKKFERYGAQAEYRLAVYAKQPTHDPIKFEIGSLEDIALIGDRSGFYPVP